ncbi:MAG: lamin tail domain-containing protein [Myxococcota bacterium]
MLSRSSAHVGTKRFSDTQTETKRPGREPLRFEIAPFPKPNGRHVRMHHVLRCFRGYPQPEGSPLDKEGMIRMSILCCTLFGCIDTAGIEPSEVKEKSSDASIHETPTPAVVDAYATDYRGHTVPLQELPLRPRFHLVVRDIEPSKPGSIHLFLPGDLDKILKDLARAPILSRHLELSHPIDVVFGEKRIDVTPIEALTAGQEYVLAVAGWAGSGEARLEAPHHTEVRVSSGSPGAEVLESFPADGTAGVPIDLASIALRFSDTVHFASGSVELRDPDQRTVPVVTKNASCIDLGWSEGFCVEVSPAEQLRLDADYSLHLSAQVSDRHGAPVGPWEMRFRTGVSPALSWVPLTCAIHETETEFGCVLIDDSSAFLRLQTNLPSRFQIILDSHLLVGTAPRGAAEFQIDVGTPQTDIVAIVEANGLNGAQLNHWLELQTTEPLATLSIDEILSNPLGPEPRQEWVEIWNYGPDPVDLAGFNLSDRADREGDFFAAGQILAPGARALIVSASFAASESAEAPIPAGTPLLNVDNSLASGGLTNSGEPLWLRDSAQRRISAAPATPPPAAGVCRIRTSPNRRSGQPGTFGYDPRSSCTPGRATKPKS